MWGGGEEGGEVEGEYQCGDGMNINVLECSGRSVNV